LRTSRRFDDLDFGSTPPRRHSPAG
jgi:hypothetical protein